MRRGARTVLIRCNSRRCLAAGRDRVALSSWDRDSSAIASSTAARSESVSFTYRGMADGAGRSRIKITKYTEKCSVRPQFECFCFDFLCCFGFCLASFLNNHTTSHRVPAFFSPPRSVGRTEPSSRSLSPATHHLQRSYGWLSRWLSIFECRLVITAIF